MKKSSLVVILLVALCVALSCVSVGLAQKRPITGGYKEISTDAPEVQEAAEFAIGEQGQKQEMTISLVSIERAESQVVAGVNYRLCLRIEIEDEAREVKAVVYRNLKKEYSLTSWEEEDCSENK